MKKEDLVLVKVDAFISLFPFDNTVILVIGDRRIAYNKDEIRKTLHYFFKKGIYNVYVSKSECLVEAKEQKS